MFQERLLADGVVGSCPQFCVVNMIFWFFMIPEGICVHYFMSGVVLKEELRTYFVSQKAGCMSFIGSLVMKHLICSMKCLSII